MYPHERSLVKRLANQPFALIGVNSDPKARLRTAMKANNITWRSFWDGGNTGGPIAKAWGVRGWPTIYVIDDRGVIRYKNVRGEAMDHAVDELLSKATSKLTESLSSVKAEERGMAAYYLGSAGVKGSKEAIANLMEDSDPVVRQRAATALALLGEETKPLLPLVRKAAADKNASVQVASLGILARAGDSDGASVIVSAMESKDASVLVAAVQAAGELKATAAVEALKTLASHEDTGVSHSAITSLGLIGDADSKAALKALGGTPKHPARVQIAAALFQAGDAESGKAFRAFLSDEAIPVRRQAVSALASLKGLDTKALYLQAMQDDDFEVRNVARKALAGSKDPEVKKALEAALAQDVDDLVPQLANRLTAQRAMTQLQNLGPAAAPLLMKHIGEAKATQAVSGLARIISGFKNPEMAKLAGEELKNPKVVRNARFAYEQIAAAGGKAVVPVAQGLLKAESADIRQSGLRLLLRSGLQSKIVDDALVSALRDEAFAVRRLAAYVLAQKGNKAALPVLIKAAESKDQLSHQYAALGLSRLKTKESSEALATLALKGTALYRLAVQSLGRQETADAARALGRVHRDGNARLKATARQTLLRMKNPEAKVVLEGLGK